MRTFDVTLKGFNGGSSDTDPLVKWVKAESKAVAESWLKRIGIDHVVQSITDLGDHACRYDFDDGIDVVLNPVMPSPSMKNPTTFIKNMGDIFQVTVESFDPQFWVAESEAACSKEFTEIS